MKIKIPGSLSEYGSRKFDFFRRLDNKLSKNLLKTSQNLVNNEVSDLYMPPGGNAARETFFFTVPKVDANYKYLANSHRGQMKNIFLGPWTD